MTNYSVATVDEYIAAAPQKARAHLRALQDAVRSAIPKAEEKIGYGKPYYKYHGWVAGFDVYKNHIGFEVWDGFSGEDRTMLEEEGYKTGSVTFQIRYDQKVPIAVIQRLVKAQAKINERKKKGRA